MRDLKKLESEPAALLASFVSGVGLVSGPGYAERSAVEGKALRALSREEFLKRHHIAYSGGPSAHELLVTAATLLVVWHGQRSHSMKDHGILELAIKRAEEGLTKFTAQRRLEDESSLRYSTPAPEDETGRKDLSRYEGLSNQEAADELMSTGASPLPMAEVELDKLPGERHPENRLEIGQRIDEIAILLDSKGTPKPKPEILRDVSRASCADRKWPGISDLTKASDGLVVRILMDARRMVAELIRERDETGSSRTRNPLRIPRLRSQERPGERSQ